MSPRWPVLVAALLFVALTAGCSGGGQPSATATTVRPTPLAKLDAGRVRVARAAFCDRVSADEVRRALGAEPDADESWDNGDPVPPQDGAGSAGGSGDVGHEIGCGWTTSAGATARAWVFARPVAADLATTLVKQAGRRAGCAASQDHVFGRPALLQTCTLAGDTARVRRAGLFGDTWLTCELAGPAASRPRARLDAWCAAVVAALDVG
jgi:hypothetical protein